VVDIDANIDDGFFQLVQVEFFRQHLQFHEGATIGIRHAQRDSFGCDAETRRFDIVVEEFEEYLHDVCVRGLAPKDIFLLVHLFLFLVFEIFRLFFYKKNNYLPPQVLVS